MIKQAVFDYNRATWEFDSIIQHGFPNTITRMNGYYAARAAGITGHFELNELAEAIMWVETKTGASNYTFTATSEAIL